MQVGEDVGLLLGGELIGIRGHAIAAVVDLREHVGVVDGLAVLERFALEQAFQRRTHFGFIGRRAVADGALCIDDLFTFSRVAFLGGACCDHCGYPE